MKKININGFEVGGNNTYIIADVGSNHMQDLQLAKESIAAAKEAGVDAVKFQSIQLNELYLNPDKVTADFVKQLEFPEKWHFELKDYADKVGITFFSSPTYLKAVDILEEINVPVYKLASAQVGTFPQMVDRVASLNKPTIFSTGIAAINEIEHAVSIFRKYNNDQFIILHCNSIYPTPAERVNLPLMQHLAEKYPDNPVGFSDHTIGTHTACAAVTMGAKVIEKHFTLDRNFKSPDSNVFASDPTELALLVKQIRDIERSLVAISDRVEIEQEEKEFKNAILYKIVAARDIGMNETVSNSNIKFLRAKDGIDCNKVDTIIGKKLKLAIKQNELIIYEQLA
jgi:sialic acid synthase SpsE